MNEIRAPARLCANEKQMLPCPRCGNNRFILADGLIVPPIQTGLSNFILGGSTIPPLLSFAVVVVT